MIGKPIADASPEAADAVGGWFVPERLGAETFRPMTQENISSVRW